MANAVYTRPDGKVTGELSFYIASERDITTVRQEAKIFALRLGFCESESAMISTLVSDVVRGVLLTVQEGNVLVESVQSGGKRGAVVYASGRGAKEDHDTLGQRGAHIKLNVFRGEGLANLTERVESDSFEMRPVAPNGIAVRVLKWF